jgi:hypothetical protein
MKLLSVGFPLSWPNDPHYHSQVLVRDFYKGLYLRVKSMQASLLTGVPGTGKSWWIWWVACLAGLQGTHLVTPSTSVLIQ